MKIKLPLLTGIMFTAAVLAGCSRNNVVPGRSGSSVLDCTPRDTEKCAATMCTREFRSIVLSVTDAAGKPVMLDSSYTTDADGVKIGRQFTGDADPQSSSYVVLNDSWTPSHWNTECDLIFWGYKYGKRVVKENFKIATSCCHIERKAGPSEVKIKY